MPNKKQIRPRNIDVSEVVDSNRAEECKDNIQKLENSEIPVEVEEPENTYNTEQNANADYGKFRSPKELLDAYNALQSEFTKRCQLVKELQAQLDRTSAQAQAYAAQEAVEPLDNCAEAQSSVCCGGANIEQAVSVIVDNIDECADCLAALPQVADAVILAYKKKLLSFSPSGSPRGMAVVMPAKRPRTLADAKALADEMLKNGWN